MNAFQQQVFERRKQILDFMKENPAYWKAGEIANKLGLTSKTVANDFRALEKRGDVVKKADLIETRYRLKEHDPKELTSAGENTRITKSNLGKMAEGVLSRLPEKEPPRSDLPALKKPPQLDELLTRARYRAIRDFLELLSPGLLAQVREEIGQLNQNKSMIEEIVQIIQRDEGKDVSLSES